MSSYAMLTDYSLDIFNQSSNFLTIPMKNLPELFIE